MTEQELWTKVITYGLVLVGGPVGFISLWRVTFAVWKSVTQTSAQWTRIDELQKQNQEQALKIRELETEARLLKERVDVHSSGNIANAITGYTDFMKERLLPAIDRLDEKVGNA